MGSLHSSVEICYIPLKISPIALEITISLGLHGVYSFEFRFKSSLVICFLCNKIWRIQLTGSKKAFKGEFYLKWAGLSQTHLGVTGGLLLSSFVFGAFQLFLFPKSTFGQKALWVTLGLSLSFSLTLLTSCYKVKYSCVELCILPCTHWQKGMI